MMARSDGQVARLGWLVDGEWRAGQNDGPVRVAVQGLVAELVAQDRVGATDTAVAVVCELLGEAVDADPTNAALWAQFRAALADLRSVGLGDSDSFDDLIAELSAPISDPAVVEPGDKRGAGR